jgi:hypothetical protein
MSECPINKKRYERPTERLQTPEILPSRLEVPENTIVTIADHEFFRDTPNEIVEDLRNHKRREWLPQHAYFCLPLTMGNQYGFVIKSCYDFDVFWNGGSNVEDLQIVVKDPDHSANSKQIISSHFAPGIITVQVRFSMRTQQGMNLLIMPPPNYFIDGVQSLTAVIETDNLRRDFGFNLKVTRENHWISIKKGQPIAAVLPYPRRFFDNFSVKIGEDIIPSDIIEEERRTSHYFYQERLMVDSKYAGGNGFRYLDGEDIYGIKFKDHQKKVDD